MDEEETVVADMDGNLFPYLSLVAFEGGGILRLIFLLLVYPFAGALYYVSESAYLRVLMFATFAGMRVSDVEWVARAVLPKFYAGDMHPESWRVRGKRCVVAGSPRMMVEPFLKEYMGADKVVGTEIASWRGRATGFVKRPAGLGDRRTNVKFSKERCIVPGKSEMEAVPQAKPIVFHDGRLVQKLTPFTGTLLVLWFPFGFVLACLRVAAISLLPMRLLYPVLRALGVRIHVKGHPPPDGHSGVLFVCSHRTLLDPIMLSIALARPVPAVTYSLSRFSELISPIKLVRLTRHRPSDASKIKKLLEEGDLVICPEGTTCREPFLLRFSSMFAEMTDELVPVAMSCRMSMFHGTTARGWKGMDPYFFFMNPSPVYEVTFLDKLPKELTCEGGRRSSHEVANYIQRMLATRLSFQCTTFTRKDKYRALVGKDDIVEAKPNNKLPHPQ